MTDCINLREQFGDRFKLIDEVTGERARKDADPWTLLIACKHGTIGVWGGSFLLACTAKDGGVARKLRLLEGVEVTQDGDDGVNVKFRVSDFKKIAKIMKPKSRRLLSDEQKVECRARLEKFAFRSDDAAGAPKTDQESRRKSRGDSQAVLFETAD